MKRRNYLALLLALTLIVSLFGCAKQPEAPVQEEQTKQEEQSAAPAEQAPEQAEEPKAVIDPVTVTDMRGRTVTLDKPAARVVALTAADCEILCALGGGEMLVGRGEYCDRPEQVLSVPSVQSGYETNIEQIIALQPDIVLMGSMDQPQEQVDALENAGIRVVVSKADSIDGVYQAITMIGTLLGKLDEADAIITEMRGAFDDLASKASGDGTETVYFEVSPLAWGLWTAGTGTFMDEIAGMLGLKNCFSDVAGWGEISEEQVLERNPDYIVTISMYYGEGPTPVEEIMSRPGWGSVAAVQNGKILNLQNDELSRPCPRLVDGAEALYQMVYGN